VSHRSSVTRRRGFSLIELVIVVVIIGIIAAIAIPRLSRGASGAADSALAGNLSVLRNAVDLYATEHGGTFPAINVDSTSGVNTIDQLLKYTDATGGISATKDTTHIFGPYLRKMPVLPVGAFKNNAAVVDNSSGSITAGSSAGGWLYNPTSGDIKANVADSEKDSSGKAYSSY
jgi:general secretion pathway protein G